MSIPKDVIIAAFIEAATGKRAPSYGPPVKLAPEASKAHAEFHASRTIIDAEIDALQAFFDARTNELRAKQFAAIRAAHPEIGERNFRIDCATDSYELQLDEPVAPATPGEKPRESPDWVKDIIKKGDVQ